MQKKPPKPRHQKKAKAMTETKTNTIEKGALSIWNWALPKWGLFGRAFSMVRP